MEKNIIRKLELIDFLVINEIKRRYLTCDVLNCMAHVYLGKKGFTFALKLNFEKINYELLNLLSMILGSNEETIKYSINFINNDCYLMEYYSDSCSIEEIKSNIKLQVNVFKYLSSKYDEFLP